jgi:hypothetical protein
VSLKSARQHHTVMHCANVLGYACPERGCFHAYEHASSLRRHQRVAHDVGHMSLLDSPPKMAFPYSEL